MGCLIVGGCFCFLGICGMVILITSLAFMLKTTPSAATQQNSAESGTFFTPLVSFLTLIGELVKYLMTPFVPILRLLGEG